VISFIHEKFSVTKLQIIKNSTKSIDIDNLLAKQHYIEVAYNRSQIDKCEYLKRKFEFGLITLLENEYLFAKTNKPHQQGQPVYQERKTNHYWYLDNIHKNHYEVFDSNGKHLGEANLNGVLNYNKRDKEKFINI
jgi:hypothetical protein